MDPADRGDKIGELTITTTGSIIAFLNISRECFGPGLNSDSVGSVDPDPGSTNYPHPPPPTEKLRNFMFFNRFFTPQFLVFSDSSLDSASRGNWKKKDPADMGDKIEGGTKQGVSLFFVGASAHDCLWFSFF
jgi:hypothetical protein